MWKHFLKLLDGTFFRMTFQFLAILFIGFVILFAVGYLEVASEDHLPPPLADPLKY